MENYDLKKFMLSVVGQLEDEGRYGTAHVYRSTLCVFTVYWEKRTSFPAPMLLQRVFTTTSLHGFEQYLKGKMLKMNTVSTYLRMLRAIYNRALRDGKVSYTAGLFEHLYTGTRADVKRALSSVDVSRILASSFRLHDIGQVSGTRLTKELEEAQMWFSLLFLFRGMPFADLARLRKCDLQADGTITYYRQKTGRRLTVIVPPEARPLLRACADTDPDSPYLLSIISSHGAPDLGSRKEYTRYQHVLRSFNHRLNLLSNVLGLGSRISSYTARHTWATIAFRKKYPIGIISNALGHSSVKVTETYLKPFETEELDKINRKIISYIKEKGWNGKLY